MNNEMGAYRTIEDFDRYGWKITMDTDELMYECPVCECRMQKRYYDLAVGTRGLNFCPYCGADMRPAQMTMVDIVNRTAGNIQVKEAADVR